MSYWFYLEDPATGETQIVPDGHDLRGGTYCVGGIGEAELNVTYNYCKHYYRVMTSPEGIRSLHGMTGRDSISILQAAIAQLGTDVDPDYWKPTEGNARAALENLLLLARACPPDSVWRVR